MKHFYSIRHELREIRLVSNILQEGNLNEIETVCARIDEKAGSFKVNGSRFKNESEIYDQYHRAFEALRKKKRVIGQFIGAFHVGNYAQEQK